MLDRTETTSESDTACAAGPPSGLTRFVMLAPFATRSFRYQWPADLLTSWAFEMETIILGWYVLVETGSVLLLTLFASLGYVGTLVAPIFGFVELFAGATRMTASPVALNHCVVMCAD